MKRVILCFVLVAALCALAAGSYFYIVGTTVELMNKVEFVAHSFTGGDYETASAAAGDAYKIWTDFRKRRFLIIDRDNVAEITASLARIDSISLEAYKSKEKDQELITECAVAAALLKQYFEKQRVNIYNIL